MSNPEPIPPSNASHEAGPATPPPVNTVFRGAGGIRAGWRVLIFVAIAALLILVVSVTARLILHGETRAGERVSSISPMALVLIEGPILFFTAVPALFMARIERRRFSQYGLPLRSAFGGNFWIGAAIGFAAISATLAGMFALHGFRLTGLAIHGNTIATSVAAWSATFVLVGLAEEFAFRGYLQFTLTTGMGFWPAAFLLSALFAFAHGGNPGESKFGLVMVFGFGLLLCLFLRRTGNLWLAVGFHTGYDWGQTFFYGVPDSGAAPYHNLLNSQFNGPNWLTGGSVGPEASVLTPIVLALVAILFSRTYRENRYST